METRGYESPLRREQAEATRRRIVAAARDLLLEQGYGTTMAAVARAAGVSAQTVYKAFGTKAELIKRVYDVTLAGDDEPVPMAQRPEMQALRRETDPGRFLAMYAEIGSGLMARLAPLYGVIVGGAAAGEADLRDLLATTRAERLTGTTAIARRLEELGALRPDLTAERARDAIWTLIDWPFWDDLVVQRGWTAEEYNAWLGRMLAAAVLADERAR